MQAIEVRGITPDGLRSTINDGWFLIKNALNNEDTTALHKHIRTMAWKPHGMNDLYSSSYPRADSLLTKIRHPNLFALMHGTRVAIQSAAADLDEPLLKRWGDKIISPSDPAQRPLLHMHLSVHRMRKYGFIEKHTDFFSYMGCGIVYNVTGTGSTKLTKPIGNESESLARSEPINVISEPGDALLLCETKVFTIFDRIQVEKYPGQKPGHEIRNIGDSVRYSIPIFYEQRS